MRCSFSIHLFVILETMITWCDFFIHFSIVYIFTLSHSWFTVDSYSYNSYLPFTCKDYLNYYPYLSYYLLLLLTIPGSCDQDPVISIFHIHGISKCMTGIFSQVTIHDSIQYSVIIDTIKRDLENTTLNISQSHLIAKKKTQGFNDGAKWLTDFNISYKPHNGIVLKQETGNFFHNIHRRDTGLA